MTDSTGTYRQLEQHIHDDTRRFDRIDTRLERIEEVLHSYKGFFAGIVFLVMVLAGGVGLAVGVLK